MAGAKGFQTCQDQEPSPAFCVEDRVVLEHRPERTLVLVGRTGNGKSATGNSILGKHMFQSRMSGTCITKKCELQESTLPNGLKVNVIDTPGLFSSFTSKEIVECLLIAKSGLDAVLLVFSVENPLTEEELSTLRTLKILFGNQIVDYVIVVFTNGNALEEGETLDDYLQDCPEFQEILKECDYRKVLFDNRRNAPTRKKEKQVQDLLNLVEHISKKNNGKFYMADSSLELRENKTTIGEKRKRIEAMKGFSSNEETSQLKELEKSYKKILRGTDEKVEIRLTEAASRFEEKLVKEENTRLEAENTVNKLREESNEVIKKLKDIGEECNKEIKKLGGKLNRTRRVIDVEPIPRVPERLDDDVKPIAVTSGPWPRDDGIPIVVPIRYNHLDSTKKHLEGIPGYKDRAYGAAWGIYNSVFYNGLLGMEMLPTKFIDPSILQKMGIEEPVRRMLANIGLGTLASRSYVLYPELVRQFLASVEVYFDHPAAPRADEGKLTYLSSGRLYEISIRQLCGLYGFDPDIQTFRFSPDTLRVLSPLWYTIGPANNGSRHMKLSLVRNPVVRIVAKILGFSLFSKEENGNLRLDELFLVALGIPQLIDDIPWETRPVMRRVNLGAVFAEHLVEKKYRALGPGSTSKTEGVGSLLTPIFQFNKIDLRHTPRLDSIHYIDGDYIERSRIFRAGVYRFYLQKGIPSHCRLPKPDWTSLDNVESIRFELPPSELCTADGSDLVQPDDASAASSSSPTQRDSGSPVLEHHPGRTLVLVGKTGTGKSSTGNSILREHKFQAKTRGTFITKECDVQKSTLPNGLKVNVIDTPDLFSASSTTEFTISEVVRCLQLAKDGFHAVLLVFSLRSRLTVEEQTTLQTIKILSGNEIVDYIIVVFTNEDALEDGETLDDYLQDCPQFQEILKECDDRKVLLDNRRSAPAGKKEKQVQDLLNLVEHISKKNNGKSYMPDLSLELKENKATIEELKGSSNQEISQTKKKEFEQSYNEMLEGIKEKVSIRLKESLGEVKEKLSQAEAEKKENKPREESNEKLRENCEESNKDIKKLEEKLDRAQDELNEKLNEAIKKHDEEIKMLKEEIKKVKEKVDK